MQSLRVACVIPTYTGRRELERLLDSLWAQTAEFDTLIVDSRGVRGEGFRYVRSELDFLGLRRWYLWPASFLRNGLKLLAFKLGKEEARLTRPLKRRLGMYKRFWDSEHA